MCREPGTLYSQSYFGGAGRPHPLWDLSLMEGAFRMLCEVPAASWKWLIPVVVVF